MTAFKTKQTILAGVWHHLEYVAITIVTCASTRGGMVTHDKLDVTKTIATFKTASSYIFYDIAYD